MLKALKLYFCSNQARLGKEREHSIVPVRWVRGEVLYLLKDCWEVGTHTLMQKMNIYINFYVSGMFICVVTIKILQEGYILLVYFLLHIHFCIAIVKYQIVVIKHATMQPLFLLLSWICTFLVQGNFFAYPTFETLR